MARSQQMFTQPGQMYAPDTQRRMALAQALRAQGLQTPQGTSMGSGTMQRFAAPHWTQYVANLAQGLSGAYMEHQAEQTNQDRMSEFVQALRGTDSPQYVMEPGYEQPSQMDRLAALEDNPFAQQAMMNLSMQSEAPQYRTLSPEEAAQMGLPEGVWQLSPEGQIEPAYEAESPDYNQMIIEGPDGQPMINPLYVQGKEQIAAAGAPRSSTEITMPTTGDIPKDHRAVYDEAGRLSHYEVIPGSPTAREIEADAAKKEAGEGVVTRGGQTVIRDVATAIDTLNEYGSLAGGFGSWMKGLPEGPANSLAADIASIQGNIAVDQLLKIKASGAGLGQVPQQQLEMLASLLGGLRQDMAPEKLKANLEDIRDLYSEIVTQAGGNPYELAIKRGWDPENPDAPLGGSSGSNVDSLLDKYAPQ